MLKRHPCFAVAAAFVAGILVSHTIDGYSQERASAGHDTSERLGPGQTALDSSTQGVKLPTTRAQL